MDRRKMMIFLYLGFTIGTLACANSPTYGFLLIARSLTGAFGGVLGALILAMVSDVVPLERRAHGIGIVMASFSAASVFGVPFGLFIAGQFSWHAPFLFLGLICAVILILIFFFVPSISGHIKERSQRPSPLEILTRIFGRKNPRIGLTFTSLLMMGHFTIIPLFAAYMVGNVGFTEKSVALIYLVGGTLTFFTSPWVGKMADRHGRLKIFTIFGSLTLVPVIILTNMPPTPIWVALIVTGFIFIFANGRMVPATTMETAIILPENRGSYMSIRSAVQQLTAGLAAFVAGLIVQERPSAIDPSTKALVNYD
jgi:predicted MFS family arabinose efflux permease